MDFITTMKDVKVIVERELQYFFSEKRSEAQKIHSQTSLLVDAVGDLTLRGGKRTRAFLVWLGYQAATDNKHKTVNTSLTQAMMGIELFQSFALIHDDIIDQDSMRRGSPTVHEFFRIHSLTRSPGNASRANHFGESMAILAGDLALAWADEMMQNVQYPMTNNQLNRKAKRIGDPSKIYQKMKQEIIFGQSLDVLAANNLPSADNATINRYKTAWYSVVRPFQIGASVAGADEKTLEEFVSYGLAVGEAYQLRDDFLDGEISQEEFDTQSAACQKQTHLVTAVIHASVGTRSLLADFARFALNRET